MSEIIAPNIFDEVGLFDTQKQEYTYVNKRNAIYPGLSKIARIVRKIEFAISDFFILVGFKKSIEEREFLCNTYYAKKNARRKLKTNGRT